MLFRGKNVDGVIHVTDAANAVGGADPDKLTAAFRLAIVLVRDHHKVATRTIEITAIRGRLVVKPRGCQWDEPARMGGVFRKIFAAEKIAPVASPN